MLDVLNFGVKGKLNAFYSLRKTISDTSYYISIKKDNKFKELAVHVPKKFIFKTSGMGAVYYNFTKLKEYEVLLSFLKTAKPMLMKKWGLSELEYEELLIGLHQYMLRSYYLGSPIEEDFLCLKDFIKLVIIRLKQRFSSHN